jgi:phosphoribosylanthranilate isomerase
LLFDAKPPKGSKLPGGNAVTFDWTLLAGTEWPLPWLLSGGLHAGNIAEAVHLTGAKAVDVSSGVESEPGQKDPARIRSFLAAVAAIRP